MKRANATRATPHKFFAFRRDWLPNPADYRRSVFLSHRFVEEDYVDGLVRLLEESGFEIITGKSSNTYVSRSVIDRIRQASFFRMLDDARRRQSRRHVHDESVVA